MSRRKTILVSRKVACDGGVSPNAHVPHITVELRAAFPPNTVTREQVFQVLDQVGGEFGYRLAEALPPVGTRVERSTCVAECNWLETRRHDEGCIQ